MAVNLIASFFASDHKLSNYCNANIHRVLITFHGWLTFFMVEGYAKKIYPGQSLIICQSIDYFVKRAIMNLLKK